MFHALTSFPSGNAVHQRVTLQRSTKRRGQSQEVPRNADQDSRCNEILIVKEMGVCVPKEGSTWGLSPRVVVGDAVERHGLHHARWDGLMPTLRGTAGESVVINLGHFPFRHPMDGYRPVCEVVNADARFALQAYNEPERMWRDVKHRRAKVNHGSSPQISRSVFILFEGVSRVVFWTLVRPDDPDKVGLWGASPKTNHTER